MITKVITDLSKVEDNPKRVSALIREFSKESDSVMKVIMRNGPDISEDKCRDLARSMFSLGEVLSHLVAFCFVNENARSVKGPVKRLQSFLAETIPQLKAGSRQYFDVAMSFLEGVASYYLEMVDKIVVDPDTHGLDKPIEGLSARNVELLTKILSENDRKTPIRRSKIHYQKTEGLHPFDYAILQELKEQGIDTSKITQEDLTKAADLILLGSELPKDVDPFKSKIVEVAGKSLLDDLKQKSNTEELSDFNKKMVELAERRLRHEAKVENLLNKASLLAIRREEDKNKDQ